MSASIRNKLYLPIVSVQLIGMLVLDLVPFYPQSLQHLLLPLRSWWATVSGDPYFATLTNEEAWFKAFLYVEAAVQLPLTAYLSYKLAAGRRIGGAAELAGLAYGCVTFMGAVACCADIWHMGPERVSEEHWGQLFWGTYLPFAVIPAFMAVDMYLRLLSRL